jgi:hypothetical protein
MNSVAGHSSKHARSEWRRQRAQDEAAWMADPEKHAAEQELRRLRDVLARPVWTAGEAEAYFSGVYMDASQSRCGGEPPLFAFLAGARTAYPQNDHRLREILIGEAFDHWGRVFEGESRSPRDWIERAFNFIRFDDRNGMSCAPPCWFEAAVNDQECRQHVPKKILERVARELGRPPPKNRHADAARAMHANNNPSKAMRYIKERIFPEYLASLKRDACGKPTRGEISRIATEIVEDREAEILSIADRMVELESVRKAIGKWVREGPSEQAAEPE